VIVGWAPRAVRHLQALRTYVAEHDPAEAQRMGAALLAAVGRLVELPQLGRPGRLAGTRELTVPHTSYVIAYRIRGARLEVIAVLHARQQWPSTP
jgi:toxin ParE1/3/4